MSIVVRSGGILEPQFIRDTRQAAIKAGFQKGLFLAWMKFQPTIAKKTGRMRRSFGKAIQILTAHSAVSNSDRISITWEEIKEIVIALTPYSEWHFRSRGFYKMPHTPNTKPMRFRSFKFHAVRLITRTIQTNLANVGLASSPFTVI